MSDAVSPTPYKHYIRVPVGGGAVHWIPNLWVSDSENNLNQIVKQIDGPARLCSMLIESFDYLLDEAITQTDAIKRLKLLRSARKDHLGIVIDTTNTEER